MNYKQITKGATDQQVHLEVFDEATGLKYESLDYNSSGIALWYWRPGAAKVAITPAALSALTDAHIDGGIEHVDDGTYRLDVPDAACATGVDFAIIGGTATGYRITPIYVHLVDSPLSGVMPESYSATPTAEMTLAQALYLITGVLTRLGFTATTGIVDKLDGTPSGVEVTVDDVDATTQISRSA